MMNKEQKKEFEETKKSLISNLITIFVACVNKAGLGIAIEKLMESYEALNSFKTSKQWMNYIAKQMFIITNIMLNCDLYDSKANFIGLADFLRATANYLEEGAKLV